MLSFSFIFIKMNEIAMTHLVSASWLWEHRHQKNLIILDASLSSTASGKQSAYKEFAIPNARHFNLKQNFSDLESSFPNTVPSPGHFEKEAQKLGICSDSKIVVYDAMGIYSSPRVWWMFQLMGHQDVAVLDGGLPAWIAADFPVVKRQEHHHKSGDFKAVFHCLIFFEVIWPKNSRAYHRVNGWEAPLPYCKNLLFWLLQRDPSIPEYRKLRPYQKACSC